MKNDPREIEDVPLSGKVLIKKTLPVFLSFDLNFEEKCDAGPLIGFGYLMSKLGYDLKTFEYPSDWDSWAKEWDAAPNRELLRK